MSIAEEKPDSPESVKAEISRWTARIKAAKDKWEEDFDRMRHNMDFVAGLQWKGQTKIKHNKYIVNMTMQRVNQKVATLYARNPKAIATRKKRMDFELWDEKMESLVEAIAKLEIGMQTGMPDMGAMALLSDYQQGKQWQELVQKVGRSLETVYQFECDRQEPEFKECMKNSVVRPTVVCGVGYVRLGFMREVSSAPSEANVANAPQDRMVRMQRLIEKLNKGDIDQTSAEVEQLKQLVTSFGVNALNEGETLDEGLIFDYPDPTSIIPDPNVKSLTTFAGARWIVQEYILPLEEINEFFGTDIELGKVVKRNANGDDVRSGTHTDPHEVPLVALWEVFSKPEKVRFFIIEGHDDYVLKPEAVEPATKRFWPIFGLVFNPVNVVPGTKATVFPPSDVDLMLHPQKEWNRARHALRAHRRANGPKYIVRRGVLSEADKLALCSAEDHEIVELDSIPPDQEPSRFILPVQHATIDPLVYDTKPVEEDVMLGAGAQEANFGYAKPNVTATVGTIAEQSRMTVASSNVDDLDGLLERIANASGEMLLREMSVATVKRIAGRGAVWPLENREDFLNEVLLSIQAASSGRPNKALDVANFERLSPILMQLASPEFTLREAVKRLDDNLDPAEAMPNVPMPQMMPPTGMSAGPTNPGAGLPQQPLQDMPSQSPVPLSAA
jgi:hypothetical protein